VFSFDPSEYFQFVETEADLRKAKVEQAKVLLKLKEGRDPNYLKALKRFYKEL